MMLHCSHSVQQRNVHPTARLGVAAAPRRRASVTPRVSTAAGPTKQPSDLAPVVLKYFDLAIAGRGGGVALFLRHVGVQYTQDDVQYDASFQALKAQLSAPGGANPLGHLPLLYVNGAPEPLIDSHAITRYVARLLGLYGKDAEHDYKTDVVAAAAIEWRNDLLAARRDATLREPYLSQGGKRVQYYKAFEELLGRFGAQGATTVGGGSGRTYADAHVFANLYDDAFVFGDDVRSSFPKLAAFHDAFAALPAVAQWILEKQQARDRKAQQQQQQQVVAPPASPAAGASKA